LDIKNPNKIEEDLGDPMKLLKKQDSVNIEIVNAIKNIETNLQPALINSSFELLLSDFKRFIQTKSNVKQLRKTVLQLAVQGKLTARWREENPNIEPANFLLEKIKTEKEKLTKNGLVRKEKPLPKLKDAEKPFELPKSWVWERLGTYTINRDGSRIPLSKSERETRQGIYDYYGASGVIDKVDDFLYDGEYLLIGEDGANLVARSTPIAFIAKGKFWVNNHAHVLECLKFTSIEYVEIYINSMDLKPFVTGGFQPKLSQGNLNIIPVSIPPFDEQLIIVNN
jgi:type I restriction enzyme, S subunit